MKTKYEVFKDDMKNKSLMNAKVIKTGQKTKKRNVEAVAAVLKKIVI